MISNIPCFREVAESAACYFDCDSVGELTDWMSELINSATLRHELVFAGYRRLKAFSWEKAGAETLAVYKGLL